MTMNEIERILRELRLSGIADTLSTRVMQAQSTQEPFLDKACSAPRGNHLRPASSSGSDIATLYPPLASSGLTRSPSSSWRTSSA